MGDSRTVKDMLLALLVIAALICSLTACGGGSSAAPAAETFGSSKESPAAVSEISSTEEGTVTEAVSENETDVSSATAVIDGEIAGLLERSDPAKEPVPCDGFEDLSWGSTLEDLPEAESTEVVCRGVEFAGYYGSAHYIFDADDHLIMGVYLLNELMSLEWIEALKIYLNVRNHLISEYGLPSEVQRSPGPSSIEELIDGGGGAWSEMWRDVTSSEKDKITIIAALQGNGMMEIQFINMSARQRQ